MNSRLWDLNKDYDTLVEWWNQHEFDLPVPKDVLPPLGIMIEMNGVPVCAAGLYEDHRRTKFGFMFGLFTNPEIGRIKLYKAMNMCLEEIQNEAKIKELGLVYTITGESALFKLYERNNMTLVENNTRSYVMNVQQENYNDLRWIMGDDVLENRINISEGRL